MQLPKEIFPNPLIISTIEIRYTTLVESEKIFPLIFGIFTNDFPKFEANNIPKEFKENEPNLKYAPDFILTNDDYKLSFSNKVILFENNGPYKLWPNYFKFITTCLDKLISLNLITSIERVGLRYASILGGSNINEIFKTVPKIQIGDSIEELERFNTNILVTKNVNLYLQILNRAEAITPTERKTGIIVDIDASFKDYSISIENLKEDINTLHKTQKEFFFNLLNQSYIDSLKPVY